ncbi:MAG TPA: 50S ribosomal protein L4 [Chlamydiales bacterium]|nr:50S ribosomal protein L4 [Chlamydiales bacterium]
MATLKKYDLTGKEIGTIQVDDAQLEATAHPQSVKDYIVALRNNARQWSASTKRRNEINRTGRKPHPQKGQGRSRQGDLAAPQYKGGGIVFGPKPKFDIHVRINKKERRAAIRALVAEKIKANQVHILHKVEMKHPKTKKIADFFDKIEKTNRRVLVLGESKGASGEMANPHTNFVKSLRNLPKKEYAMLPQVNGYELARCQELVVLDSAVDEFLSILGVS